MTLKESKRDVYRVKTTEREEFFVLAEDVGAAAAMVREAEKASGENPIGGFNGFACDVMLVRTSLFEQEQAPVAPPSQRDQDRELLEHLNRERDEIVEMLFAEAQRQADKSHFAVPALVDRVVAKIRARKGT